MFSKFIYVVAYVGTLFLFMAEYYSFVWIHHILSLHPSVDGRLGCFHPLAIANNTAMGSCVQGVGWTYVVLSPGSIPRSGIARSHGDTTLTV